MPFDPPESGMIAVRITTATGTELATAIDLREATGQSPGGEPDEQAGSRPWMSSTSLHGRGVQTQAPIPGA